MLGYQEVDVLVEVLAVLCAETSGTVNVLVVLGVLRGLFAGFLLVGKVQSEDLWVVLVPCDFAINDCLVVGYFLLVHHLVVLNDEQEISP